MNRHIPIVTIVTIVYLYNAAAAYAVADPRILKQKKAMHGQVRVQGPPIQGRMNIVTQGGAPAAPQQKVQYMDIDKVTVGGPPAPAAAPAAPAQKQVSPPRVLTAGTGPRVKTQHMDIKKIAPASVPVKRVDISHHVAQLKLSATAWNKISSDSTKEAVVSFFIDEYKKRGVVIKKDAKTYVTMINGLAAQNPALLSNPFDRVLRLVAIIEYDYGNGQNKDDLARQVLGEQGYTDNRKRLGLD